MEQGFAPRFGEANVLELGAGRKRPDAGRTPNRNGARHCCQAPLRRAKDMPVFVTLIQRTRRSQKSVFDPGSPAQASPPIEFVRKDFIRPIRPLLERSFRFGGLRLPPEGFSPPMFRGPSWAGSLSRGLSPWGGNRPRKSEVQLFRRLLPTGPEIRSLRHRPEGQFSLKPHSIACRRRSVLPSSPHPLAVAGLPMRRGLPSRSRIDTCTTIPSRAKRKMRVQACG